MLKFAALGTAFHPALNLLLPERDAAAIDAAERMWGLATLLLIGTAFMCLFLPANGLIDTASITSLVPKLGADLSFLKEESLFSFSIFYVNMFFILLICCSVLGLLFVAVLLHAIITSSGKMETPPNQFSIILVAIFISLALIVVFIPSSFSDKSFSLAAIPTNPLGSAASLFIKFYALYFAFTFSVVYFVQNIRFFFGFGR